MRRVSMTTLLLLSISCAPLARAAPVEFPAHADEAWRVAFSPDGKQLATAGKGDQSLMLWDVATQKLVRDFGDSGGVAELDLSPDGTKLLIGSWHKLKVWNVADGKLLLAVAVPGQATGAAFSPDGGKIAVSTLQSNLVQVFDAETGKSLLELKAPMKSPPEGSRGISRVCFAPDGKALVAACGGRGWPDFSGEDSAIAVWDMPSGKLRASFPADRFNINGLAISPSGELISATCHRSKTVKLWNMPKPVEVEGDAVAIARLIEELDSDEFGMREGAERQLLKIGKPVETALGAALAETDSAEVRFRAGRILKAISGDGVLPLHVLGPLGSDTHCVAFSPDGKLLAVGCAVPVEKSLLLWTLADLAKPVPLPGKRGVWHVSFALNGALAAAHVDGTVSLWKAEELKVP